MPIEKSALRLDSEGLGIILESIADGLFTVDPELAITSFNRAAERITGFTASEAIGQRCYNIFRTSVCQSGCLLAESIRTGRIITAAQLTALNRQNEEIPISVSTAVLKNRKGEIIGGVETFRDLTAVEGLRREMRRQYSLHDLVSKNHRMQEIFALLADIASSRATVLIQGETGTGKDLLARAIHEESPRSGGPFVKVNCGALPDALLESELFGHVAGAFTDAKRARQGRFDLANRGTIFLDEIGDTSPAMQVKLLRVLQEGRFEPVGSSRTRSTDVRVIAATHRDLRELVRQGKFREDLYYRVNTVRVMLPPLRARREDIPLLVDHFIERFGVLTGKRISTVSGEAMRLLMSYPWFGNVRELEHAIEHAFVLVRDGTLDKSDLPEEIVSASPIHRNETGSCPPLAAAERDAVLAVLERHHWNKIAASRELGISRSTLWRKMRRLGIGSTWSQN